MSRLEAIKNLDTSPSARVEWPIELEEMQATAAPVFHAGDRVMLTTSRQLTLEQVERMRAMLADRFPGVEFGFVTGVDGVAVQREDRLSADAIEKINAGAALAYALYHIGEHLDWLKNAPETVRRANMRAQAAYGIGHHRSRS